MKLLIFILMLVLTLQFPAALIRPINDGYDTCLNRN